MGTTLSDCSHFVTGKLLCHWRQATVIMVGCIVISFLLAHLVVTFAARRFRVQLFMASPSCCPFGFPFRQPSRTECLTKYSVALLLRSDLQLQELFRLFSFPVPRDILRDFRLLFLPLFNSTFQ